MTKFKSLRAKAGLDTDEAAEKLEISKSMLYKIEQGYRNPSTRLLLKMSETYKCKIQDLFAAINITNSELHISNSKKKKAV